MKKMYIKGNLIQKKRGFTLIEVIGAIVILAMVLVPVMRLIPAILRTHSKMAYGTNIVFLAQGKAEQVKDAVLTDFDKEDGYSEGPSNFQPPHGDYVFTVTDNMNPGLKTISVSAWNENMPEYNFTVSTQIADRQKPN
jgi:prepilin-type N-terminal cleavage/methylation domain-containing protein